MADNKRSSSNETLARLLRLLQYIPEGQKITVAELRAKLEQDNDLKVPSERTLQRDLKLLAQEVELDVTEDGRTLNYSRPRGIKHWIQPGLGEKESLLLMMAQSHLSNLLPDDLKKVLDKQFHRAGQILDLDKPDSPQSQWRHKVRVVQGLQPLLPPELVDGVFEQVSKALYRNKWLTIDYCNQKGEIKQGKRIKPLGLAQQEQRLYLICLFQGYEDQGYRSLVMSRIHSAKCGTESFTPPQDFCMAQLEAEGFFGVKRGDPINLSFNISLGAGRHLLESRLSNDQTHQNLEDGYRISATVPDTLLLERWLNSFGDEIWGIEKLPVSNLEKEACI